MSGGIHDYLAWRGDLSLDAVPLCEADRLILCELGYVSFGSYAPSLEDAPRSVPLKTAVRLLLEADPNGKTVHQTSYLWEENRRMLEALAQAPRFRDLPVLCCREMSGEEFQFGAMCVGLGRRRWFVSFRGTDDSVSGWREDGLLALPGPVQSQNMAAEYLDAVAEKLPGVFFVGGHSKGGNLAVWAAASCSPSTRGRVISVTNCDGPGFTCSFLQSEGYRDIRDRVEDYLPRSSVVGRLLEHEERYETVESSAQGIMQHAAFSWQIRGGQLVQAKRPDQYSDYMASVIAKWIAGLSDEQRLEFINVLTGYARAWGIETLDQITPALFAKLPVVLKNMRTIRKEDRAAFRRALRALGATAVRSLPGPAEALTKRAAPKANAGSPEASV